jgi:cell division protein FtsZ
LSENSTDEGNWQDTIFEIKDKNLGTYRVDEYNNNQRKINFNMQENDEEQADVNKMPDHNTINNSINSEKNAERIRKIKETHSIMKEKGLKNQDVKDNIDELEDEPAYIRRNININNDTYSSKSKVSRYSLGGEDDKNDGKKKKSKLRDDNSYLHDNVD